MEESISSGPGFCLAHTIVGMPSITPGGAKLAFSGIARRGPIYTYARD